MSSIIGSVRGRARALALLAPGLVLLGCEVPAVPEWDVGVIAPFSSEPLAIVDFLPSVVDTATVGGERVFTVEEQRDSIGYTLGEMCPPCQAFHGLAVPVPGFDFVDSLDVVFSENLYSVEILSAQLGSVVTNGLDFDPLRPDPDPGTAGFIAVAVHDLVTDALLDSVFVSGATETLPLGTSREFQLQLSEATVSGGVRTILYVHSPDDGQLATIDTAARVSVGTFLTDLEVAAVTAEVDGLLLDESFLVDVDADARQEIAERVQAASYEFELTHDLELTGSVDISLAGSAGDLFSGDPMREVRLSNLSLASGVQQDGALTIDEIQLIAIFPDAFIGYRSVAFGTRQEGGLTQLARFTPSQQVDSRLKVLSRIRVGE